MTDWTEELKTRVTDQPILPLSEWRRQRARLLICSKAKSTKDAKKLLIMLGLLDDPNLQSS